MLFSLNGLWRYRCCFHSTDYGGMDVNFIERIMEVYMLFSFNGLWRYICYLHWTDYGGIDVIFIERILEI
jgi:hypothetical protein